LRFIYELKGIKSFSDNRSDYQSHSRSSAIMPFDSLYVISYLSSILPMSLFCTVSKILLISGNLKTSRNCDHAHSRDSL